MTIKELSEVCNVSTQSIRNYCKRNNLTKQHNNKGKATYVIDEETENAIISYFNSDSNKDVCKDAKQSNQETNQSNKALFEVLQSQIDDLRKQVDLLTSQLIEKDNQLKEKDLQIKENNSQIHKLLDTNAELNKSVQQAHTLQYQQQIAVSDSEADAMEQEQPTEKKKGFFSRFKKSK